MTPVANDKIREELARVARVGPKPDPVQASMPDRRRARRPRAGSAPSRVRLVEQDGLLVWQVGAATQAAPSARQRRAARRMAAAPWSVLYEEDLGRLGVNQIGQYLADFDQDRNPAIDRPRGYLLRQWSTLLNAWTPPAAPPPTPGRLLVIVHGTASSCEHILSEIQATGHGKAFLAKAAASYKAVLAFDHPTLSVSPAMNALDLAEALKPYGTASVDIVCHSRGGLVAAWWMHSVDAPSRSKRCVFAGSPLDGTSLANPARLRASLRLLASYGKLLGDAAGAMGFIALPLAILKVASSVVDLTAKLPLLDAGLAMIPGLAAQSRTDNNFERQRLLRSMAQAASNRYYLRANFNTPDPGWKLWEYVTKQPADRMKDAAADWLVFDGANDLVVDTDAMTAGPSPPPANIHTFEGGTVHHNNYFRQPETFDKIRQWLGIA